MRINDGTICEIVNTESPLDGTIVEVIGIAAQEAYEDVYIVQRADGGKLNCLDRAGLWRAITLPACCLKVAKWNGE